MSTLLCIAVIASNKIDSTDGSIFVSCAAAYDVDIEVVAPDGTEVVQRTISSADPANTDGDAEIYSLCDEPTLERIKAELDGEEVQIKAIRGFSSTQDPDGNALILVSFSLLWSVYEGFWIYFLVRNVRARRRVGLSEAG